MQIWRHGDVFIQKIESLPNKTLEKKGNNVLLAGEVTGHNHRLQGGVIYKEEPTKENQWLAGYFEIESPTEITHEEHKTIVLEPGIYKFHQQREYDEQEEFAVLD